MLEKESYKRRGFTARNEMFIQEYVRCRNATEAAKLAGYSPKCADVAGSRLMKNEAIREAIEIETLRLLNEKEITKESVLAEVARLAFGNAKNFFAADGSLRPIQELPDFMTATIASIEHEEIEAGRGEDRRVIGMTTKIKLADKSKNLQLLMQYMGLLRDKPKEENPLANLTDEALMTELAKILESMGYVKPVGGPVVELAAAPAT